LEPDVSDRSLTSVVVLVVLSICSVHRVAANELESPAYAALNRAVLEGKEFRMLLDLSACQVHGTSTAGPPIKGSIHFDGYMIRPDGTIAFATTHFTARPDKPAVRESLSFRVHVNGKVEARTMVLDAATYTLLRDTAFDCEIGKGASFHW
jgi:hypothetical protein